MKAELVDPARAALGEGPLWDPRRRVLHWIDIDGATWHRWSPTAGRQAPVPLAQTPGFLGLHVDGDLVAGVARGFARLADDGSLTMVTEIEHRSDHRMNDGEVDPHGRVWGSTVAWSCSEPTGALWRLDVGGPAHQVLTEVTIGNGIAFTEAGDAMWFIDSATRSVDRLDVDPATGAVSHRRSVVTFPDREEPDGLCVDAEGGLWVAVWNGWSVRRFDASGRETDRVDVDAAQVTSCAFGGDDLDQLFVTTAAKGVVEQPNAGGLFVARPGVRGRRASLAKVGPVSP